MIKITFRVKEILGQYFFVPEIPRKDSDPIIAFNKIEADWFAYASPGTIQIPDSVESKYWVVSLLKGDTILDTACIRRYPDNYAFQWKKYSVQNGGNYAENFSEGQVIQVELPQNISPEDFTRNRVTLGETRETWRRFDPPGYILYIKGAEAKMFNPKAISENKLGKIKKAIELLFLNEEPNLDQATELVGKDMAITLLACKIMITGNAWGPMLKLFDIQTVKDFLMTSRLLYNISEE